MGISVYITSYNQKDYLIEAIESVLAQTLPPVQIVIVDDCSTDGSQEIIARYAADHPNLIMPIYHARNRGIVQVRLSALSAITGAYVTGLDGDDLFMPTKLERESQALQQNPAARIAFSNYFYINEAGIRTGVWAEAEKPPQGRIFLQTFARMFPRRNLFRSELVHYDSWKAVGFYDPQLPDLFEDYEMRIRLTRCYPAVYCDEPLCAYRIHNKGLSRRNAAQRYEVLNYIYQKTLPLLAEVSSVERQEVQQKLGAWIADFALAAAFQYLEADHTNRSQAWRYYLEYLKYGTRRFNIPFLLKLFLPRVVYTRLRTFYQRMLDD